MGDLKIIDLFGALGIRPDKGSFDLADRLIGGLKNALAGLFTDGVTSIKEGFTEIVALGGKLNDMSAQVGIDAETLQGLGYAAAQAGGSLDSAAGLVKKFSKLMQSAADGSQEARKTLKGVGVDYKGILAGTEPLGDALIGVADRFKSMEDGPKKTALAMKLFGRSGADLIPMLNEGSEGIRQQIQDYKDMGGVLSNEAIAELDTFGDSMDQLSVAGDGLKKEIVVALIPVLQVVVKDLIKWFKENRKIIAQGLQRFVKGVVVVAKLLYHAFVALLKVGGFLLIQWKALTLILVSLGLALLVVKAGSFAAGYAMMMAGLKAAAAWLAAAIPLLAIAAIIAVVILIVEDLWTWFDGGDSVFKDLYESAKKWIGDKLATVLKVARFAIDKFLGRETEDEKEMRLVSEGLAQHRQEFVGETAMAGPEEQARVAREISRMQMEALQGFAAGRMSYENTFGGMLGGRDAIGDKGFYNVGKMGILDEMTYDPDSLGAMTARMTQDMVKPPQVVAPQMTANITVNVPAGTDAVGVANATREASAGFWDEKMRDLDGGDTE